MITEERRAEIEAKHITDPIWRWFNRTSHAYWGFAGRVAGYFPQALGRVRSTNPFVGITRLTFLFVAGFIIVPPLYLVLGPLVQIVIVIIALTWTCLAGVSSWFRPSAAQSAESTALEQHAAQNPKSDKVPNKLTEVGTWLLGAAGLLAVLAIPALFLVGAELLSEFLLPWFNLASILALAFVFLVVFPLSVFKRCRGFTARASLVASFVFGADLWMKGLLLTLALWGSWAVWVGLFMMGVGIVPIAMVATLFAGMWGVLVHLVVLAVLTFGARFYALWIGNKGESSARI